MGTRLSAIRRTVVRAALVLVFVALILGAYALVLTHGILSLRAL
jgi:hypothetical protein